MRSELFVVPISTGVLELGEGVGRRGVERVLVHLLDDKPWLARCRRFAEDLLGTE